MTNHYEEDEEQVTDYSKEQIAKKERAKEKEKAMLKIAEVMGSLGTCSRARVGCVIVRDGRIIASGYNSSIKGEPHCDDIGHEMEGAHCKRTIHAEQNALMICAKYGIATEGCKVYVTHTPCRDCDRLLKQAGIIKVYVDKVYHS